jgi:hypothetical protein
VKILRGRVDITAIEHIIDELANQIAVVLHLERSLSVIIVGCRLNWCGSLGRPGAATSMATAVAMEM